MASPWRDESESPWEPADIPPEDIDAIEGDEAIEQECPRCGTAVPLRQLRCPTCRLRLVDYEFGRLNVNTVLKSAWRLYARNSAVCTLASLVDLLLIIPVIVMALIPAALTMGVMNGIPGPARFLSGLALFGFVLVLGLATLSIGNFRFFLKLARGEPTRLQEIWHGRHLVFRMILAGTIFWTLFLMGLMLFLFPAALVWACLWPYGRILVDRKCSVREAFSESLKLTQDHFLASLSLMLINLSLFHLLNMIPLGFLFGVPFVALSHSVAYLHLCGETVAFERETPWEDEPVAESAEREAAV